MSDVNTSSIEDCGRPIAVKKRGWCSKHYQRWRKSGSVEPLPRSRAADRSCIVEGCPKPQVTRGWCSKHYQSWKRHGDPLGGQPITIYFSASEAFAARTQWSGDCLIWTGAASPLGYGIMTDDSSRRVLAHRWAWEQANGPIPEGIVIDHRCHNTSCVRAHPDHLRPVTQAQNVQHRLTGNRGAKSPYIGVAWDKQTNKWRASVKYNGVNYNLGRYSDETEAASVARQKRLELFTHNDADRSSINDLGS